MYMNSERGVYVYMEIYLYTVYTCTSLRCVCVQCSVEFDNIIHYTGIQYMI